MFGINQKNGRLIIAAAAALALGQLGLRSAQADVVLYSTGFEAPGFTGSAAPGTSVTSPSQGGFVGIASGTSGSTNGVVQSPSPTEGAQSLEISHVVGGSLGVAPQTTVNSLVGGTVTTQFDLNFTAPASSTAGTGPFFGVSLWGNNGAQYIGSFGVDAATGDLVDTISTGPSSSSASGNDLSVGTPPLYGPISAAAFHTLSVVATFEPGNEVQLQYYLGTPATGTLVDTETTTNDSIGSFDYAYLFGGPGSVSDQIGTAYFDNYSVSTSVPEPASLALLGLAGTILCARRSRVRQVAGL